VKVTATAANLQSTDLKPAMDLSQENNMADFPSFDGQDINERLFVADDVGILSRVSLFAFGLTDNYIALVVLGEKALKTEFKDEQLALEAPQEIGIGEEAAIRKFGTPVSGGEGYVLCFRRGNALVRMIFYGPPGYFNFDQATAIAAIVDSRLISAPVQKR
jgi:hypothetical protein